VVFEGAADHADVRHEGLEGIRRGVDAMNTPPPDTQSMRPCLSGRGRSSPVVLAKSTASYFFKLAGLSGFRPQ